MASNQSNPSLLFSSRFRVGDVLVLLLIITLCSCQQKTFDSKDELMAFVKEPANGYAQQKSINGIEYAVTYKPTDVMVQQMANDDVNEKELDSLRNIYNKYMYFSLTLSKNNQEVLNGMAIDRNKFGAMVNQLAFGMGEKVNLVSKTRDTLPLADYIYPRLYGMGGGTNMLFVYPRDKKIMSHEFFHLTIEDMGLATGEVGFKIPTEPINNEPSLAFK